jgi:hypothetical protein
MAYAVSLLFNSEIADAVSDRWQSLADAGLSRSMVDLGYRPHLTLAVYDALAVEAASAVLDRVFDNVDRIPVTLTGFSTFGAGSGVCYAALASSPDLMRLHCHDRCCDQRNLQAPLPSRALDAPLHSGNGHDGRRNRSREEFTGRGLAVARRHIRDGGFGRVCPGRRHQALASGTYSPFHPQALSRSRICSGGGAVTRTGSLFLEIGITISRECRCRIGSPKRGPLP